MSSIIQMPKLPKPSTAGTIRRWLKREGDSVAKGEVFLEIETERAVLEIESSRTAVLAKVLAQKGQTVKAGDSLAEFSDSAANVPAANPKPVDEKKNMESQPSAASDNNTSESIIPIPMPKAGNDMEEGTLVKWVVSEGTAVKPGDVLFEIETDKATMEIESEYSGTIQQILVKEGETVAIHTPLAYLATSDAVAGAITPADAPAVAADMKQAIAPESKIAQTAASNPPSNVVPILMPKAGNDMEEGTVVKWLVSEGSVVKEGDVLFELETDKATMEIESEHAGKVRRIVVAEGSTVAIHTPLAYIADSDADVDAFIASGGGVEVVEQAAPQREAIAQAPTATARSAAPVSTPAANGGRVKASPAARRLAAERNIDLATVAQGSGAGGRIMTSDLSGMAAAAKAPAAPAVQPAAPGEVRRYKMTPMRKAISKNLTASVQTAPHFYMRKTIEAVALLDTYKRQKKACGASLNDLLVLAIARTMMSFPAFRSRVEGEEVAEYPSANIGIAVGTDDGLRVPVVLGVDRMSLAQLAQESRKTIQMAREGKAVNMGKGNFTISNLGMFEVEDFTAIINPPEAAILAVGATLEGVKVENGAMKPTKQMTLTLSSDHRLIDGLQAAKFLNQLKEILENPESLEG